MDVRLVFHSLPFLVRHLDFRENGASDKVGTNTVENLDPENIRVDTEIMFVSRRVPKLGGGGGAATLHPHAVRVKKKRSAVRGLIAHDASIFT